MFLLFDIGGTNTRIAVSSDGKTISQIKIIPTSEKFEEGLHFLKQTSDELSEGQKIESVAGGIAGPLNKEKTMLASGPHVSGWIQKPLKTELEKIFSCRVLLENDTAIEGLGESVKGAGLDKEIVAFINIGTGIGGVRVVEGKIDRNSMGFEPGHQIIIPDGNDCTCRGKGHWEAYVSGLYLERIYGQKAAEITDPDIWDKITRYTAIGLTNVTVHWSPDIIILGGSVSKRINLVKLQLELEKYLTIFPTAPKIAYTSLGTDAGLYGALELLTT